jgi:hypothetical protein
MDMTDYSDLCDKLRSVPDDLIIGLVDSKDVFKPTHSQINIGDDAHAAAAAIEALEAERDRLRVALRTSDCPRPADGAEEFTVGWCVDMGLCGCNNRAALALGERQQEVENAKR